MDKHSCLKQCGHQIIIGNNDDGTYTELEPEFSYKCKTIVAILSTIIIILGVMYFFVFLLIPTFYLLHLAE